MENCLVEMKFKFGVGVEVLMGNTGKFNWL